MLRDYLRWRNGAPCETRGEAMRRIEALTDKWAEARTRERWRLTASSNMKDNSLAPKKDGSPDGD